MKNLTNFEIHPCYSRFKGVHLGLYGKLRTTKLEMEETWGAMVTGVNSTQREQMPVETTCLSPTSKLLMTNQGTREQEGSPLQQEMKLYETYDSPSRSADICQWWKMYETTFPMLARMAKMILAIPASSAMSERVFSAGSRTVTCYRGNLAPAKVEEMVGIKANRAKVELFKSVTSYKIDEKEEEAVDVFDLIGVSVEEGVVDDLEEGLGNADYEDLEDLVEHDEEGDDE